MSNGESQPSTYRQLRFAMPAGACDVLLVRHGESCAADLSNPFPVVDGHADPPLSPVGREQAQRLADRLAGEPIDAVYVTTLRRTAQTAQPLLDARGLRAAVAADLREVFLGEWEGGLFRKHVAEGHPTAVRMLAEERWDVIPGAETSASVQDRVRAALSRIAAAHPDQRVVVVAHGGVIGCALALATGSTPFAFIGADNASLSQLVLAGERWILRRFNDTAHLDPALTRRAGPLT